ncbi:MAG TPA: NRDE family protein [Alphaproteobacteria bacterium]|nr:NRDE family protein [Alphaproteobacteria bacterium]
MCTFVILRRPDHPWPVLIAANRDEMRDRLWQAPARHWTDRPNVVGGMDELAGGSWLAVNDEGVVAAIMNRRGTLGPMEGKRSRGELVLEALDHADASDAAVALSELNPRAYRPFNMVLADNRDAYWIVNRGTGRRFVEVLPLPAGLSMICADDRNDPQSSRIRFNLPRFEAAPVPDAGAGDWSAWESLLESREHDPADGPEGALRIETGRGFATTSSSLIALPAIDLPNVRPIWRFAAVPEGGLPAWHTVLPA